MSHGAVASGQRLDPPLPTRCSSGRWFSAASVLGNILSVRQWSLRRLHALPAPKAFLLSSKGWPAVFVLAREKGQHPPATPEADRRSTWLCQYLLTGPFSRFSPILSKHLSRVSLVALPTHGAADDGFASPQFSSALPFGSARRLLFPCRRGVINFFPIGSPLTQFSGDKRGRANSAVLQICSPEPSTVRRGLRFSHEQSAPPRRCHRFSYARRCR